MNLGFIALSGLRVKNEELARLGLTLPGFIERKDIIASLPSLGLLTLAGMTPDQFNVQYLEVKNFDLDSEIPQSFDVVAISSFTAQINSAYLLADKYRKLGTKVILGGLHVTLLPEEAMPHADAIVIGEGEAVWDKLTRDLLNGTLKPVYDARNINFDLAKSPVPKYELLDPDQYNRLTVQTQRGCPFRCEFCASSIHLSSRYKLKPISNIVEEIKKIKSIWSKPFLELADDNSFANKVHSKKLIQALSALDIKWFTETDISIARDNDLISMLSDSGCKQLLIGFESPTEMGLHGIEKKANWKEKQLDFYLEGIHKIQSKGISVNGCFILGLDGHELSIFDDTLNFVKDSKLSEVQITIQTPFPGTDLYQRLKTENRLLKEKFWDQCTLFDVTYRPKKMTVTELESGFRNLMQQLYQDDRVQERKTSFIRQARKFRKDSTNSIVS